MKIAFFILGFASVTAAYSAIRSPNVVYSILSLMAFFVSVAGLYVLLMAEFIAAAQVLVYVGPVVVLILFALMLTPQARGRDAGRERVDSRGWGWGLAAAAGILFGILIPAAVMAGLPPEPAVKVQELSPNTQQLGRTLMMPYTPALELMAVLLTAALLGAVVISTPRTPEEVEAEAKAQKPEHGATPSS